jgi:hypothetical protein
LGGSRSKRAAVQEPPVTLMTLKTALDLMRRLVARWLTETTHSKA